LPHNLPIKVRYAPGSPPLSADLDSTAGPLLELCRAQTASDGLYLYALDPHAGSLDLVAWRGLPPIRHDAPDASYAATIESAHWARILDLRRATWLELPSWQDPRVAVLPEFRVNQFAVGVVVPLGADGKSSGLLTAARKSPVPFEIQQLTLLGSLQFPLASLLSNSATKQENAKLAADLKRTEERLSGRAQIERAKGLLQARHQWTEEEAYLHLRRLSRNNRKPIAEIARQVVHGSLARTTANAA
jgi:hypothetical protein